MILHLAHVSVAEWSLFAAVFFAGAVFGAFLVRTRAAKSRGGDREREPSSGGDVAR